jgi:hypothetical protein
MTSRTQVARQLQRAVSDLSKTSLARMEREMPWVGELPAEHRAWIGTVLQAGYNTFIAWFRNPDQLTPTLTVEVFGNAPRSLAGVISLQQTVAMIRLSIEVAESDLTQAVAPEHQAEVRMSILRYGRELAFATADVYAHAAETRGAWDARLEALVVDSVIGGDPDETVRSRASALGWGDAGNVAVLVGRSPQSPEDGQGIVDEIRASARAAGLDALGALHGDRLVVVVGGVSDADKAGAVLLQHFGDGPVVIGPVVPDLLQAHASAAEAMAGLRAATGWPTTPPLVTSEDLLAERALDGDRLARQSLVNDVYIPLLAAGPDIVETLTVVLDQGGSIEGAARVLFVHPNTVRYRLRRVLDATGLAPGEARHAFILRVALILGRLSQSPSATRDPL